MPMTRPPYPGEFKQQMVIEQLLFCKSRLSDSSGVGGQGFMVRWIFPVIHASSNSVSRAETGRRQEAALGNIEATRVRRFSSRWIRSSPLVVRSRTRCAGGSSNTAKPSGRFASAQSASFGESMRHCAIASASSRCADGRAPAR